MLQHARERGWEQTRVLAAVVVADAQRDVVRVVRGLRRNDFVRTRTHSCRMWSTTCIELNHWKHHALKKPDTNVSRKPPSPHSKKHHKQCN
eukprot:1627276-Rhodomonas_salina.2